MDAIIPSDNQISNAVPKKRRLMVWLIVAAILIVLSAAVYYFVSGRRNALTPTITYTLTTVTKGDISKTISSTGQITTGGLASLNVPVSLDIIGYTVSAGNSVKVGDPIAVVNTNELHNTISALNSEISTLDTTIANLYSNRDSAQTLTSPYTGRVKQIIANYNDSVKSVISEKGALMILSADGKMKVETALSEKHKVGDELKVVIDKKTYVATVQLVSGENYVLTFTDLGPKLNADVSVKDSKAAEIGKGKALINTPLPIVASDGKISKTYVSLDKKVYKGTSLFYLKEIPLSDDYYAKVNERAKKLSQLSEALKIQSTGVVTSSADGIIESLGATGVNSSVLLNLYVDGAIYLNVSVDELEIASLNLGQKATVTLDAVPGKTYSGEVTYISEVGANSSGVTNYSVVITLEKNDIYRIGMNAQATITIENQSDTLLIPLSALQSVRNEQFVWVSSSGEVPTQPTQVPGTRTVVKTGLSNSNYAEVVEGLSEGDQVIIISNTAVTTESGSPALNPFQGQMNVPVVDGSGNRNGGGSQRQQGSGYQTP
jgi:HlyD family secretion protein